MSLLFLSIYTCRDKRNRDQKAQKHEPCLLRAMLSLIDYEEGNSVSVGHIFANMQPP